MNIAVILPLAALGLLVTGLVVLAPRKRDYSHVVHTISELGEVGAPDQRLVAWSVFFPVGLLLLPITYRFQSSAPAVATLAGSIAAGYLIAALFPCDPGSPVSGTLRQGIHNLGGAVEYLGGGLSLFWAAERFGFVFRVLGFVVVGVAFALTVLPSTSSRGLVQRIGEACLFGALTSLVWLATRGI